ncbi:MAG: fibronectin type III domain-containing protein [Candidatus Paceibacterota bacterium]|jgi:hypothetical protein|nr:fibronectin type III domain-containing protein [Candidatus Paceibacterota bacterium]
MLFIEKRKILLFTGFFLFLGAVFSFALTASPNFLFAQGDGTAPLISNVKVASTTEDSAIITWTTNKPSDSLINYGLDRNYGMARDPAYDKKAHTVTVGGLESGTTYYFRVVSSDADGNQSLSGGFAFTTPNTLTAAKERILEKIQDSKMKETTAKIMNEIEKVTSTAALKIIQDTVKAAGSQIDTPPTILGVPDLKEIGYDYVIARWVTDKEANTMITFASDAEYQNFPEDKFPYTYTQGDPDKFETVHEIRIIGLLPGTKYHLRVFSEDKLGLTSRTDDQIFTTKSQLPIINSVDIVKIEETAVTVAWNTNIPASGNIEYTNTETQEVKTQGSPEFAVNHSVRIANLTFGTQYTAIVKVENEAGDKVISDQFSFVTVKDVAPPIISKVTNESTLYPTSDAKIQTIVNWDTDELSICQFYYRQSLAETGDAMSLDPEINPNTAHVQVVLEFLPSTVYKFWLECKDETGNKSRSEDFVLFTPDKEKSIIDIIMENFQGTFGWVKNIGK